MKTRKVTLPFEAQHANSRRRERFGVGELLQLRETKEAEGVQRFIRIVGLRPPGGLDCEYTMPAEELIAKTEVPVR